MDSLKFYLGPPCPILLCPAGGPPLKRRNGRFGVGPPAGQVACYRILPFLTRHATRLCFRQRLLFCDQRRWIRVATLSDARQQVSDEYQSVLRFQDSLRNRLCFSIDDDDDDDDDDVDEDDDDDDDDDDEDDEDEDEDEDERTGRRS
jgi:hypothetical protein